MKKVHGNANVGCALPSLCISQSPIRPAVSQPIEFPVISLLVDTICIGSQEDPIAPFTVYCPAFQEAHTEEPKLSK